MELFEMIRREHVAGETILGLAKKHGLAPPNSAASDQQRNPTGKKIGSPQAPQTGAGEGSDRPDDRVGPERSPQAEGHGAPRVWARLREEHPEMVAESNLEHYLDVLECNPGAMAGSTPLSNGGRLGVGRPGLRYWCRTSR